MFRKKTQAGIAAIAALATAATSTFPYAAFAAPSASDAAKNYATEIVSRIGAAEKKL